MKYKLLDLSQTCTYLIREITDAQNVIIEAANTLEHDKILKSRLGFALRTLKHYTNGQNKDDIEYILKLL